ncbi:MAG TPA: xanthine dehydrogenase family protein subunit M [Burkholderiales bacterium]
MRAFELLEPRSVAEASAMLLEHGEGARALAGGTSLVLLLRNRLAQFSHVVHIGRLAELRGVLLADDGSLRIGALTTHAEVAAHPAIRSRFPVLAEMAAQVANPQVRNVATLGGNLCLADPASDPPTCLAALGARVRVRRGGEAREIELERFFRGYYETALEPGEVLTEVIVPPLAAAQKAFYTRFITTPAEGRPLVSVAACVAADGAQRWQDVRLVLGAAVGAPLRMARAEEMLKGRRPDAGLLAEAAARAAQDLDAIGDVRASAAYRREVARVLVRRVLERALEPAR